LNLICDVRSSPFRFCVARSEVPSVLFLFLDFVSRRSIFVLRSSIFPGWKKRRSQISFAAARTSLPLARLAPGSCFRPGVRDVRGLWFSLASVSASARGQGFLLPLSFSISSFERLGFRLWLVPKHADFSRRFLVRAGQVPLRAQASPDPVRIFRRFASFR
jgi:hypothetical protein